MTIAAATGIGFASQGCGKPVLRVADASLGDYYTDKEFKRLREDQRREYCEELAEQDSMYREEIAEARQVAERYAHRSAQSRAAVDSLGRLADSLDARIASLRSGVVPSPRQATPPEPSTPGAPAEDRITVRAGDSLWRISARQSIYGDGRRWNHLYDANRDHIRNADRIYPGQEIRIPR